MVKYVILDFGKVIAYPTTGNWFITPKFTELIDMSRFTLEELNNAINKYNNLISEKLITLEDEYNMYLKFFECILNTLNYPFTDKLIKELAYDITYSNNKYQIYPNIIEELTYLKDKYRLIMITDNWPCVNHILEYNKIDSYFEKIYISSVYGYKKSEKVLFDIAINDYHILPNEAIFVDDNEHILDVAKKCNLIPILMDRDNLIETSNYQVIHDLRDIEV
jgi:putative hydrolase of the HAD superfamily